MMAFLCGFVLIAVILGRDLKIKLNLKRSDLGKRLK
jgi:hypothetical protein